MKTIKLRALWFKAVAPATKTISVDDDFFDQIQCGIPDSLAERAANISELKASEKKFFNEFDTKTLNSVEFPMLRQVVDKIKYTAKKSMQYYFASEKSLTYLSKIHE